MQKQIKKFLWFLYKKEKALEQTSKASLRIRNFIYFSSTNA